MPDVRVRHPGCAAVALGTGDIGCPATAGETGPPGHSRRSHDLVPGLAPHRAESCREPLSGGRGVLTLRSLGAVGWSETRSASPCQGTAEGRRIKRKGTSQWAPSRPHVDRSSRATR